MRFGYAPPFTRYDLSFSPTRDTSKPHLCDFGDDTGHDPERIQSGRADLLLSGPNHAQHGPVYRAEALLQQILPAGCP